MRISDWSSDGCSSDLLDGGNFFLLGHIGKRQRLFFEEAEMAAVSAARQIEMQACVVEEPREVLFLRFEQLCSVSTESERSIHVLEGPRSEEHTSELQSLTRSSYAVIILTTHTHITHNYD